MKRAAWMNKLKVLKALAIELLKKLWCKARVASKAWAAGIAAAVTLYLAQQGIQLPAGFEVWLQEVLNAMFAGALAWVIVYFSPKNQDCW